MEGTLDIYGRAWNPDRVDIGAAVYDCKGLMLMLKRRLVLSPAGSIRGVICSDLV